MCPPAPSRLVQPTTAPAGIAAPVDNAGMTEQLKLVFNSEGQDAMAPNLLLLLDKNKYYFTY
jgi:hypothetical protein